MFCTLKLLQKIRWRTPVSTHTPTTSAAIAALTFRGTAILLIVTHFLCQPFDHYSTSASAIVFEASAPEESYRFPHCELITSIDGNFPPLLCASNSPVVCLLPGYVLCRRASRNCRCSRSAWQLFFSTMTVSFFELYFVPWANSPLIHIHALKRMLHP